MHKAENDNNKNCTCTTCGLEWTCHWEEPIVSLSKSTKGFRLCLLCVFFFSLLRTKNVVRKKEWAASGPGSWLLLNEYAAPEAEAAFQRGKALAALCSALTFSSSATQQTLWYLALSPVLNSLTQEWKKNSPGILCYIELYVQIGVNSELLT